MNDRRRTRLAWAVLASVALHAGIAWWLNSRPTVAPSPVRLEVVLTPSPPAEEPVSPTPEATVEPPPESLAVPPIESREPAAHPAELAEAAPPPRSPAEAIDAPRFSLNLDRPDNWDELVGSLDGPGPGADRGLTFKPELAEQLAERTVEKRRASLLAQRSASVRGTAEADYARRGARGREEKVNGSCYTLVDDSAAESGSRWWVGPCSEARRNPLTLAPAEYDALGRMIAE